MKAIMKIYHEIIDWLFSKIGIITMGVFGGVFTIITIVFFVFPYMATYNPGSFQDDEFHELRNYVLASGQEKKPSTICSFERTNTLYTLKDIKSNVYLSVSPEERASDYFEFTWYEPWTLNEMNYLFEVNLSESLFTNSSNSDTLFQIEINLRHEDGSDIEIYIDEDTIIKANVHYLSEVSNDLVISNATTSNRRGYIEEEDWEKTSLKMYELADKVKNELKSYPGYFGYSDGDKFISRAIYTKEKGNKYPVLADINKYISVIAVIFDSIFVGLLLWKKSKIYQMKEVEEKVFVEKPTRESRLELFLNKHDIKPIFGEQFFRIIGLSLLIINAVSIAIFTNALIKGWNESVVSTTEQLFTNLSSIGALLLMIVIVERIADNRTNLNISAWFFLTLAFAVYMAFSSTLFSIQISNGRIGTTLANNTGTGLPGNIFLGIGLYAIIGFFLFFEAPESVINRKVFRLLSFIPALVALASIIFSYRVSVDLLYVPSYWIGNLLFIKDFNLLFIGIGYEYSLFIFRHVLKKRYGTVAVDDYMTRPIIQFQKNISLCLVIILFLIFFAIVPSQDKNYLGINMNPLYYLVLIPFLLFLKPAKKNPKIKSDIIYYVMYTIAWIIPSIPGIIESISNGTLFR